MEYVLSAKNNLPRLPTFSHFHLLTTNSASLILKGFNDLYLAAKDLENDETNLSQLTCPSKEKVNIKIINNISYLLPILICLRLG